MHQSKIESPHAIFNRFDDPRRFKIIEVGPLDKDAIESFSRELIGSSVQEGDLNHIFEASGGNPLYAIEVMKTLISQTINSQTGETSRYLAEMNHRVEEIICFRLDKLDSALQIVLKAAAIAASNGKAFDVLIISFILMEHDYFADLRRKDQMIEQDAFNGFDNALSIINETFTGSNIADVENALEELAATGEFIQYVEDANDAYDADNDVMVRCMEFKIPIEQATIYGLIVDEQKEYFHERAALYYIRKMQLNQEKSLDTTVISEEAYHWEHSSLWSRALRTYLKLGDVERSNGNEREWLKCIYKAAKMYKYMEEETCHVFPFDQQLLQDENMIVSLIKKSGEIPANMTDDMIELLERELDPVYEVFGVDLQVMPLVAKLYVDLVTVQLFSFDDVEQVIFALGVAIKLFVACNYWPIYRKYRIEYSSGDSDNKGSSGKISRILALQIYQNQTQQPETKSSSDKQDSDVKGTASSASNNPIKATELENHELLCTCSMVKLLHSLVSNANEFLNKTMLDTAYSHIKFYLMDNVQTLAVYLLDILHSNANKEWSKSFTSLQELHKRRDVDDCRTLISSYNLDVSLYTIAQAIQYLVLSGLDGNASVVTINSSAEKLHNLNNNNSSSSSSRPSSFCSQGHHNAHDNSFKHSDYYIKQIHGILRFFKHGPSLSLFLYRALPTLVHLNNFEECVFFLEVYRNLVSESETLDTIPPKMLVILRTWVHCMQDLAYKNGIIGKNNNIDTSLLEREHVEFVISCIESRTKASRLTEESQDGITLQLEIFAFNCGCSLEFIALQLTAYQIAFCNDPSQIIPLQTSFTKRLENVQKLSQYSDLHGTSLNIINVLIAIRYALTLNGSFPAAAVKSSLSDCFTYRLYTYIESLMQNGLYHAVYILGDYAINYLQLKTSTNSSVGEKYRQMMSEALKMQGKLQQFYQQTASGK
jgi:hypothetical protein